MTLNLVKSSFPNYKQTTELLPIDSYNPICQNTNLLLVCDAFMGLTEEIEGEKAPFIEIFKVLFVASCKVKPFKNELLVAFYISEEKALEAYVLSGLPNDYNNSKHFWEVDYQSYLDLCELTGERKLSFADFFQAKYRDSACGLNSLLIYNGKTLNFNEQNKLWAETK